MYDCFTILKIKKWKIKLNSTYKGTRILFNEKAKSKRYLLNQMIEILELYGYQEIMIPIIQKQETFQSKVGDENRNMMFNFKDRGERDICLAPEYTAIVQQLSIEKFKFSKDIKMFYIGELLQR
jgi:histidyl-tRNA synthetase